MATHQHVDLSPETHAREPSTGWLRTLGIGFVVLGVLAIAAAFVATLATVLFFGALLLVGGIAQIVHALHARDDHFAWQTASGLIYLVAGALLVFDPVGGAVGLTLLLAAFFFLAGVVRLSLAGRERRARGPSGTLIVGGVLDLLLGLLIVLGWPQTGGWVIGTFLGIELVFCGLAMLVAPRPTMRAIPTTRIG
jgi:uncharacterized membrane protein HdeD (DUF308 family)